MEVTRQSSAGRTFQSLFGSAAHQEELLGDDDDELQEINRSERITNANEEEQGEEEKEEMEDTEVWDDDFPSDINMEANDTHNLTQTISAESRRSIADWADHDDDEDNWKDALQARVDQLELVVDKTTSGLVDVATHGDPLSSASTSGTTMAMPGTPVDQRATLTLVPKSNLSRAVSAPPASDDHGKSPPPSSSMSSHLPSRLKSPSNLVRASPPQSSARRGSLSADLSSGGRKRSNSRDIVSSSRAPTTLLTDHKRLLSRAATSVSTATATGPSAAAVAGTVTSPTSNSVFVRAVVARGSGVRATMANGRPHDTRIPLPATPPATATAATTDGHHSHVDKRARASDRRSSVLALSDAETVRRFILDDVKTISVERIVADAKRLHFLEDFYRRQQQLADQDHQTLTTGSGAAAPAANARQLP